jgi:glutamate/tyrosine decarboxylase-like PLP-dependent enzyme
MSADEFRTLGHDLVDQIAGFYESLATRDLTRVSPPDDILALLGTGELPEQGTDAGRLLADTAPLLFDHSLHNGHPNFLGYITSSASPLGALADLLAAAVNSNLGKWELSPIASEIETQSVRWLADMIGFERDCGGVMVSGGNMANFLAFVAARTAVAPWDIREQGNYGDTRRLTAYASAETHTWIQKAADVCGLGARGIRWIETDDDGRMRLDLLRAQIEKDRAAGRLPFLVVGTGGSVSTGIVDPVRKLAAICDEQDVWFHVDGAYGAPAAVLPEAPDDLRALGLADSVALDPHKWLYCPIEVACVVTKSKDALQQAFSFRPEYYHFDASQPTGIDYFELGMQNTRGFRALKVWLSLRQAGRQGFIDSIRGDVRLAERLYDKVDARNDFEAHAVHLSITTFRYVPADLADSASESIAEYLNVLNKALLAELQSGGELFLSNAIANGRYLLRSCIVNFRTLQEDIDAVPASIAEIGSRLDSAMRPAGLAD